MLIVEDGKWKACVNDRDNSRSAWLEAPTFNDLCARLELGIGSGSLDWRQTKKPVSNGFGNWKNRS